MALITHEHQYKTEIMKHVFNKLEIYFNHEDMGEVLRANIDIDSIKEQVSKVKDIEKYKKVEIYFDGHHIELTPEFVTKEEFKGLK